MLPAALSVAVAAVLVATVLSTPGTTAPTVDHPRIGQDHWHAAYQIYVCGQRQPNAPTWEGIGVHTHSDGIIHTHPFTPSEEGRGARLVKWFEYGGGLLDTTHLRIPGQRQTLQNGDRCPNGDSGEVQVFVNGAQLTDWSEYIPQDGDRVVIAFGRPEGLF